MNNRLNDAIDRTVREMLDVEPPADLRAKVIARIDERPASGFQLPAVSFQRFAAVAGAAALLIVVLFLARRSESPVRQPVQARAGANSVLTAPQPVAPEPIAEKPVAHTHVARAAAPLVYAAAIETPDSAAAIDPLKPIAPIEVASITQSSIAPEPIGVRPLNPIPEVQIAPLNPPDGRN